MNFTFVRRTRLAKNKANWYAIWRCEHGVEFEARVTKNGPRNKHCPCNLSEALRTTLVHGESPQNIRTVEYNAWRLMRQRCNYKKQKHYRRYGGRGIKVCARWNQYANFLADMGRRPIGTSLDRVNNDGDYEPGNCRWATASEQNKNRKVEYRALRAARRKRV